MYTIKEISKDEAFKLVWKFHYNNTLPRLIKHCLGGFINDELVAVMTLGWGVRPLHTIRKLFPSLTAQDYYENGRMCLDDKLPRNSESQFISECVNFIKVNYPNIKRQDFCMVDIFGQIHTFLKKGNGYTQDKLIVLVVDPIGKRYTFVVNSLSISDLFVHIRKENNY